MPPVVISAPPRANSIPATETLGATGWPFGAGAPGSNPGPAADAEFCVEGTGLAAIGEGAAAVVVTDGGAWMGAGSTVTADGGVEAPRDGAAAPGSGAPGWGCGCTGGPGVVGGVGVTDGRGVGELLGGHVPTSPRRPGGSQGAATAVPAGASAIRHKAKGSAARETGTFRRVMASTLPTVRQLAR
jgi:hypothetical protein